MVEKNDVSKFMHICNPIIKDRLTIKGENKKCKLGISAKKAVGNLYPFSHKTTYSHEIKINLLTCLTALDIIKLRKLSHLHVFEKIFPQENL